MGQLSRREFLQFSGITLLASRLDLFEGAFFYPQGMTQQGRALTAAAVYAAPAVTAPVVRSLWPDSIMPLTGVHDDWYRLPDGWVQRDLLQPMTTPYTPPESVPLPGESFWAEVAAPVAPVRAWCAADAPLVTRIGHGGVAWVMDALPADQPGMVWYGIAGENGDLLGWTPGVRWRAVAFPESVRDSVGTFPTIQKHITVNRSEAVLTAWEDGVPLMTTPAAIGATLQPGTYRVQVRQPAITWSEQVGGQTWHGVPWALNLGAAGWLAGAYWHNRFGAAVPGPALQVAPASARWLLHWLNDDSPIIISG